MSPLSPHLSPCAAGDWLAQSLSLLPGLVQRASQALPTDASTFKDPASFSFHVSPVLTMSFWKQKTRAWPVVTVSSHLRTQKLPFPLSRCVQLSRSNPMYIRRLADIISPTLHNCGDFVTCLTRLSASQKLRLLEAPHSQGSTSPRRERNPVDLFRIFSGQSQAALQSDHCKRMRACTLKTVLARQHPENLVEPSKLKITKNRSSDK